MQLTNALHVIISFKVNIIMLRNLNYSRSRENQKEFNEQSKIPDNLI
jgi:hypothetical protein